MSPTPRVSICVPNLNTRAFLAERFESLYGQTFQDWEIIVSDNYSEDGAWEFFQAQASKDSRVRLSQALREGMYANWNNCIRRARGEFVYVATSDDTATPELLERLVAAVDKFPNADIAMCDFQHIDEESQPLELEQDSEKRAFYGEWIDRSSLRNGRSEFLAAACFGSPTWVTITSVLFRKSLLTKTGLFPTNRGSAGDLEWALRACLHSDVIFVPGRFATWRVHGDQATKQVPLPKFAETILSCIEAVLSDSASAIPREWQARAKWKRQITAVWRNKLWQSHELSRSTAFRHPRYFLRNLFGLLRTKPAHVRDQIIGGLAQTRSLVSSTEAARELISIFHSPWPPTATDR